MFATIARRAATRSGPELKSASVNVAGITPQTIGRWLPTLAVWGVAAGSGVLLYTSSIPKFKNDLLLKIPFLRNYYVDDIPPSDKPF